MAIFDALFDIGRFDQSYFDELRIEETVTITDVVAVSVLKPIKAKFKIVLSNPQLSTILSEGKETVDLTKPDDNITQS